MLIPSSVLPVFTIIHVALSLVGIAAGFVVVFAMIAGKRHNGWTKTFLVTTVLTSVTGFGFPIKGITPGIVLGILSLVVLVPVLFALYAKGLAGVWRTVYVIGAVFAFYLNFFVLIVQSFQKIPALHALAPNGSEPPFVIAQVVALVGFIVMGVLAFRRHPAETVAVA